MSASGEYIEPMNGPTVFRRLTRAMPLARAGGGPSQCRVCARWPSQPLCEQCITRFAQPQTRCPRCAIATLSGQGHAPCTDCTREPPPLARCVAAVDYAFPWSRCIAEFKFQGDAGWAAALAQLMRHAPWAEDLIEQSHQVLPIPLSDARLRERGFNQSLLLARAIAAGKTDARLLLRVADARVQHALARRERLHNLQQAFALEPTRAVQVQGQHLLLVDDVMTTGATLHAAARVLLDGGAASVSALVLARTPAPQ